MTEPPDDATWTEVLWREPHGTRTRTVYRLDAHHSPPHTEVEVHPYRGGWRAVLRNTVTGDEFTPHVDEYVPWNRLQIRAWKRVTGAQKDAIAITQAYCEHGNYRPMCHQCGNLR